MTGRCCYQFRARDRSLALGVQTRIMGIINATPDSFSGDGRLKAKDPVRSALRMAKSMCTDGADIIDIGGESTRPNACAVSSIEECRRVVPIIEALASSGIDVIISVDTSKACVAKDALKAGAHLVNVVQSNALSRGLLRIVRDHDAGIVLMHMRGTPRTMQTKSRYRKFIPEVLRELDRAARTALEAGIERNRMIVDPGIGFAKTAGQNFMLIKRLNDLNTLGFPILVGPSRKSFIGTLLGLEPSQRLFGTVSAAVASVMTGAHIVRVHDVLAVKQAVTVADAILSGGE